MVLSLLKCYKQVKKKSNIVWACLVLRVCLRMNGQRHQMVMLILWRKIVYQSELKCFVVCSGKFTGYQIGQPPKPQYCIIWSLKHDRSFYEKRKCICARGLLCVFFSFYGLVKHCAYAQTHPKSTDHSCKKLLSNPCIDQIFIV